MPPEVTLGVLLVVVGAFVVVVVATLADDAAPEVGEVEVVVVVVVTDEGADELDAPGCSLATTTPISTVAPVAATTAERVNRRRRRLAFSRDSVLGTGTIRTWPIPIERNLRCVPAGTLGPRHRNFGPTTLARAVASRSNCAGKGCDDAGQHRARSH